MKIYLSKSVEYNAGKIWGLALGNGVATTMLRFMLNHSVEGIIDIAVVYPIHGLNSDEILKCHNEVNDLVYKIGFNVVVIFVDNASCNRKFFIHDLHACGGFLKSYILNNLTGQPIIGCMCRLQHYNFIYTKVLQQNSSKTTVFSKGLAY